MLYGGSFNPPTLAHVGVVDSFMQTGIKFGALYVVPTYEHCYGKELAGFDDRIIMCARAFLNKKNVYVSNMDQVLQSNPRGSMYDMCRQLLCMFPDTRLSLIVGQDQAEEIASKWHKGKELLDLVTLYVVPRADAVVDKARLPPKCIMLPELDPRLRHVSSTKAREALSKNKSVEDLLPSTVAEHAIREVLYTCSNK